MSTTSLQQAAAAGRQIYVRPKPQTLSHARDNLRTFSDETATRPQPKDFIPVSPEAIISQLDFFHLTSFMTVSFNETNWLG
jgi:hypothetical protein